MSRIPILDELTKANYSTHTEIDGKWYIAKPLSYGGLSELMDRVSRAWQVLIGRVNCYRYADDAIEELKGERKVR